MTGHLAPHARVFLGSAHRGAYSLSALTPRFLLPLVMLILALAPAPTAAEARYQTVSGAGGVPLNVVSAGEPGNPGILFIHGIGQSHFMFHRQFNSELSEDFHLVAFDLRGHGGSGKPWAKEDYDGAELWAEDVDAVLAATSLEAPVVVAWSYGSLVLMDYLRQRGPESVRAMVLTGALGALLPFRFQEDDPLQDDFARLRQQQLSPDPRDQAAAVEQVVDWLTASAIADQDRDVLRATSIMFPAYARKALYARRPDNQDLLPMLDSVPTLLAMGAEDNALMLEDAAALAARFPGVTYSRYEGGGHSVFYELPERFNRELRVLMNSLASGKGAPKTPLR